MLELVALVPPLNAVPMTGAYQHELHQYRSDIHRDFFACLCKECTKGVILYTRLRQLHVPWVMNPLALASRI